jgi:hypothetical protein
MIARALENALFRYRIKELNPRPALYKRARSVGKTNHIIGLLKY